MFTDLRHSIRALIKNASFTTIAVVTLALGIGANTAIFSVVHAVLLRSLPFSEPHHIVKVWTSLPDELRSNHSAPDFLDLQRENQSLAAVAGYRNAMFTAAAEGRAPVQLEGAYVTADFFDVLGAPTALGRTFSRREGDSAGANMIVLGYSAWQQLFGDSQPASGRIVRVNDEPYAVAGVLRPHAEWPQGSKLWVLSEKDVPPSPVDGGGDAQRDVRYFEAIGRLASGVTIEQARADLSRVAKLLQQRQPPGSVTRDLRAGPLREELVGDVRLALLVLQGSVGVVLLIACANVSSLLIARAAGRRREIAIRAALGAGRGRLIRHLLTESFVLAAIGGGTGLMLGAWLLGILVRLLPEGVPRADEIALDPIVAAVTMATAMVTGLLFGVIPALQASRTNAGQALKAAGERGSATRGRARAVLVVAEIALTVVLLVAAGLLVNSFLHLQRTDSGLQRENVTVMSLALPPSRYPTGAAQTAFYRRLVESLQQRPELQAAAVGFPGPLRGSNASAHFFVEGRPSGAGQDQPFAHIGSVSEGFFRAMGIPLIAGRTFTNADRSDGPAEAIVSVALARRYWPGEHAIGKRLRFDADPAAGHTTVVGIVGDVRQLGLDKEPPPLLYIPYGQFPLPFTNVTVRGRTTDSTAAQLIRSQLNALDPEVPAGEIASLATLIDRSIDEPRFRGLLLGAFAGTALLLAAVGVYGLISYSVAQRRREIGIRVALGAQPRQVLAPVIREGLTLAGLGIAIGIAGALLTARIIGRFLFGVGATDPATFAAVCAMLGAVALIATYVPARRALNVDTISALRVD
jgi:putative ABC transport system permease protein